MLFHNILLTDLRTALIRLLGLSLAATFPPVEGFILPSKTKIGTVSYDKAYRENAPNFTYYEL